MSYPTTSPTPHRSTIDSIPPPPASSSIMTPSLNSLPAEVHRAILSFMDISSLAALSTTQRPVECNLSSLASDDTTWYSLVRRRFGIGCSVRKRPSDKEGVVLVRRHSSSSSISSSLSESSTMRKKRPMSYGGSTWKEAYRSLSSTMRIPETLLTNNSTVFASPSRFRFRSGGGGGGGKNHRTATTTAYSRRGKMAVDYLGVWSLLNHAENCRTKTVASVQRRNRDVVVTSSFAGVYNRNRRYLEVKLCLQNTKSGFGCISIPDIGCIRFVTVDEEDSCGCCSLVGMVSHSCSKPSFPIVKHGPWAPKILLRKRFNDEYTYPSDCREIEDTPGIILHPLELVVLSIHISCSSDMVYETDVLSTLSSIRVPVIPHIGWKDLSDESGDPRMATAHFLPEDLLWDYYSQLPGGCLSLVDRSRLIPV